MTSVYLFMTLIVVASTTLAIHATGFPPTRGGPPDINSSNLGLLYPDFPPSVAHNDSGQSVPIRAEITESVCNKFCSCKDEELVCIQEDTLDSIPELQELDLMASIKTM